MLAAERAQLGKSFGIAREALRKAWERRPAVRVRGALPRDCWLLVRVAAQNIGQSRLRAIFLGLAVMLGVGVGFASFVAGWALHDGIATSFARMGADLVVVPRAAMVNITSTLLTVQPTNETLDAALANNLGAIAGIARVAPQRLVPVMVDGRPAQLIAFDPVQDFSVLTWLDRQQPGGLAADAVIAGRRAAGRLGEPLTVCGKPLGLYGRLGMTGVGPFDESYFVSFDFVSIVGRSGSGKSTLLAMLGALTQPTEGRVSLDGTDLWALSEIELASFRSRNIGFIFQFPSLLASLTAVDNVAVPALLGRAPVTREVYARAHSLLARVRLAGRADAYPADLSGGEQRRVAIARALVNSPRLLLADEPTSDLDEDTEADVIDLLEALQRTEGFGLVLVTHNLELARRARRRYEMRQGLLAPLAVGQEAVRTQPQTRRFGVAQIGIETAPATSPPIRLGASLWRSIQVAVWAGAAVLAAVLLADMGVAKYEEMQVRENGARLAKLADMALSSLQGEVQSVTDLGNGHYELAITLRNARADPPIYVMSPDMRGYVQVGGNWLEIPLEPADDTSAGVAKIDDVRVYRYRFEARVGGFTQLLPNYMHVRFSDTMLVSPSSAPNDDVFERKDNYYIYLKPFDISDETILRRMKFTGRPPVWIPMPPH